VFDQAADPWLAALSVMHAVFAVGVWRRFLPRDPLRTAWALIASSAVCRAAGYAAMHWLAVPAWVNPLAWWGGPPGAETVHLLRDFGDAVNDYIDRPLLAIAFWLILREYRRLGLPRKLKGLDYVLLGMLALWLSRQGYEWLTWMASASAQASVARHLEWVQDPIIGLLLLETVLLRRAAMVLRGGLPAKCWFAYVVGIAFVVAGNVIVWAGQYGYLSSRQLWPGWLAWIAAATAFACAPTYQLEAMDRALHPGRTG
jgi:hypothetical protein